MIIVMQKGASEREINPIIDKIKQVGLELHHLGENKKAGAEFSETTTNYWAAFDKTGNPNGPGLVQ